MKKIIISALIMLLLVSSAFKVEAVKFPPIVSKNWNGYTFNFYPNGYFTYADFVAKIDVKISDLVNLWTYPLLKPDHILANTKDYVSFIYLHDYATIILWFKNQPELHRFKWGLKISCNELLLMKISLYLAYFNQVTLKQTRIIGENSYFDYYDIKSYKMNITHSKIHKIIKFDIEFGWFEKLDIDPIFGVEEGSLPNQNINVIYTGGEPQDTTYEIIGSANITYKLLPTDDSYTDSYYPSNNYGNDDYLLVGKYYRSYLKFDLSAFSNIESCIFNIFSLISENETHELWYVENDNWNESTLTYNNKPSLTTKLGEWIPSTANAYYTVDITSKAQTENDKILSLSVKDIDENPDEGDQVNYVSKDNPYKYDDGQTVEKRPPFLNITGTTNIIKVPFIGNRYYYAKTNYNTTIKLTYEIQQIEASLILNPNITFYIPINYGFINCTYPNGDFYTPSNATFTRTSYNATHDKITTDYIAGNWTWYFESPQDLIEHYEVSYYNNIEVAVSIKTYERCNLTVNLYNYTTEEFVKEIAFYQDVNGWKNFSFIPDFDNHFWLEVRAKTSYTAWIEYLDFWFDSQTPQISLLSPAENSFVSENDIISLEITDSLSGILSTSYKWENGEWQSFTVNYNLTVPNFGIEQPKTLYVKATDKCGNTITESYTFKIDNLPPTITMTTKPYRKNYDTVTFQITDYAGVKNATYYIYSWEEFSLIEDNSYSFTIFELPDGNRTIKVKAYDNLGHEIIKDFWVIVDNEKPTIIRILPVEDVVTEGTAIDFDISDFTSGIDYVRWRINNGEWQILPYPYSILNITAYNLINGTNRLDVEAYDLAGNKEIYTFTFLYGVESPTMKQIVQSFLSNMLDFFINPVVMMTITFVLTIMITMIIWYKFIAPRMLQGEFAKKHPTLMGTITMGMTLLAFSFTFILAFLLFSR